VADRVALFLDYQNVYRSAREMFHPLTAPHWNGQINPVALGELLVERSPFDRQLDEVRLYRGIPDSTKDPKGYSASQRQIAEWSELPKTRVITRTLRYPYGWPREKPEEKGIDVSLAVDFVRMAVQDEFDVGIMMSTDTDLKPALEAVVKLGTARVEVTAWSTPNSYSRRLSIKGQKLWCHWLDETDYHRVQDTRDYNIP
jgi:uncharacterized LabA/DUF88 family protein